jgi:ATP/maltotriose-dependent transcriptional regulator MalT
VLSISDNRTDRRVAAHPPITPPPSIVYLHLGLGDVLYEQNNLDHAAEHVQAGLDLVQRRHTLTHVLPLLLLAQARICQAHGDQAGARAALQQADEHPNVLTNARVQALAVLRRVQL